MSPYIYRIAWFLCNSNTLICLSIRDRGRPARSRAGMHDHDFDMVALWGAGICTVILMHERNCKKTLHGIPMELVATSHAGINYLIWMHTDRDMFNNGLCGLRQDCLGREGVFDYEYRYISLTNRQSLYSKTVCICIVLCTALCMSAYTYVYYDYICIVLSRCMSMNAHSHTEYELYAFCNNFGSSAQALDQTFICDIR